MPILIRCDATPETGYESFYQCLTYAAALQRRRRGTYFFSRLQPATLAGPIQRGGNEWKQTEFPIGSSEDAAATVDMIQELQAAAVIVAGREIRSSYLDALSQTGALVVTIDTSAGGPYPRGLLVNPLLAPTADCYLLNRGCQALMGARYAMVRPFCRRMRLIRSQEPAAPFRIFVAMGDDDGRNQAVIRTKELLAITRLEKIDVAIRSHHSSFEELMELKNTYPDRLDVVTETADVALRVGRCHMAVTSGDCWSLELACVGIPQLLLVQSAHHLLNAQRLDDESAATNLGDCESVSASQFRQAVQNLMTEPRERLVMTRCSRKLIDGRGPDRLVNALEIMLANPNIVSTAERIAA
jgi:spore coat polysaccharide biosynthesis predicted glycosyltransferase SpsG